jgi:hypothetical protein
MHLIPRFTLIGLLILFVCTASNGIAQAPAEQPKQNTDPLFQQLTTTGIVFPDGTSVVLEPPTWNDSLAPDDRRTVMEKIAGEAGWERFSRNSHVAPIEIDLQSLKNESGQRVGHAVYVAFVAHIELEQLRDKELMKKVFPSNAASDDSDQYQAAEISNDRLLARGIQERPEDTSYIEIKLPLLDRVLVEGCLRTQVMESNESITLSAMLDPRFSETDSSSPGNRWSSLSDTEDAKSYHPYQGVAGYLSIAPLDEPKGASLVEARFVIHEPIDWFRGSSLLRSKLPLMIQESVRKFRRQWNERPK